MKLSTFISKHFPKLAVGASTAAVAVAGGAVSAFASGNSYTVQPVPSPQPMNLASLGNLWLYAQSMLQDTIAIISQSELLITITITMGLLGVGIGLFKRLIY